MTTTLSQKARHGRTAALASLAHRNDRTENVSSIFDLTFDDPKPEIAPCFVTARRVKPANRLAA